MAIPLYPLKIKQKLKETKDSVSFVFEVLEEHKNFFTYTPAQFLTFDFQIKSQNFLRSYSLSSCPLLNEELKTTIKRVKGGIISNYMIDHLEEGNLLSSRKPAGRFFRPPKDLKPKNYFLFGGGSGITPLFSIIKTVLLSDSKNKVSLFYANRDANSIIYYKELHNWIDRYKKRFNIIHILSREKTEWCDVFGRLEKKHLKKYFSNITISDPNNLYYLCGPLGFMNTIEDFLNENKVQKTQIQKESFFSSVQNKEKTKKLPNSSFSDFQVEQQETQTTSCSPSPDINPTSQPEVQLQGKEGNSEKAPPKIIKAFIDEEEIIIPAEADIPILEQLLSAGHSPPFSCLSGSCMSCLAILKKGRIRQEEKGILEDENLKNYEILTCQAKPESYLVEVDYDNL